MIQNLWLKFVSVFYPWRIDDSFMKNWWFIHWSGTQWEWTVYNNKFDFLSVWLDMVNILKQLMFTLIVNLFASPITEIGNSFFSSFSILRSLFPLFYVSLYFLQIFLSLSFHHPRHLFVFCHNIPTSFIKVWQSSESICMYVQTVFAIRPLVLSTRIKAQKERD